MDNLDKRCAGSNSRHASPVHRRGSLDARRPPSLKISFGATSALHCPGGSEPLACPGRASHKMKNPYWHYFISLEKDFLDSIQFVELDDANRTAFSIVYAKMLFSSCAEVEVV